jgi:hypothetical protein
MLSTIVPRELREWQGLPIFPPVRLGPGGSVEIWLVIGEDFGFRWQHAYSTLNGARVDLLQLLVSRGMRLVVEDVCAQLGIKPARPWEPWKR